MTSTTHTPASDTRALTQIEAWLDESDQAWVVMFSSPRWIWFAVRQRGKWEPPPQALLEKSHTGIPPTDFSDRQGAWRDEVYSLRGFNGEKEFRWLKGHEPVLVSAPPESARARHTRDNEWTPWRRYLIGQGEGSSEKGWSLMSSGRVGCYPVPLEAVPTGARACFEVAETRFTDKRHGTVSIRDEVVLRLSVDASHTQET